MKYRKQELRGNKKQKEQLNLPAGLTANTCRVNRKSRRYNAPVIISINYYSQHMLYLLRPALRQKGRWLPYGVTPH